MIEVRKNVRLIWNDWVWCFQWTDGELTNQDKVNDAVADVQLKVHDLPDALTLRFRSDGDRMWKSEGKASKKTKDIFIDKKVSLIARDHVPLLAYEKSILWIPGIWGPSPKNKDNKTTGKNLIVSVSPLKR